LAGLLAATVVSVASAAVEVGGTPEAAPVDDGKGPAVTIYSSADPAGFDPQQFIFQQRQGYSNTDPSQVPGFGVVKEVRELDLKAGVNALAITDVAALIDPTTVSFTDLDDGKTAVLEQQFAFDLVSSDKLLEKYLDKNITLRASLGKGEVEKVTGKLLSNNNGQIVLQNADGLRVFNSADVQLQLENLPEGLITKPTLKWRVNAEGAGTHKVRTTYQTSGLTWRADYNLVLNGDDTAADLGAWVTLLNLSGTTYGHAKLKLIAGDVQRVQPGRYQDQGAGQATVLSDASQGFQEKGFFEYHLYTLPRRTDILQNSTQQIALFPTNPLPFLLRWLMTAAIYRFRRKHLR